MTVYERQEEENKTFGGVQKSSKLCELQNSACYQNSSNETQCSNKGYLIHVFYQIHSFILTCS